MSDRLTSKPEYLRLMEILGEISDLGAIRSVLGWDQEVNMPLSAAQARAVQMRTLAKVRHQLVVSDELSSLLETLEKEVDLDSLEDAPSVIRLAKRMVERERKLPEEFVMRRSQIVSMAFVSWQKAKESEDFAAFRDDLQRIVEVKREEAELLGYPEHPYDALLDLFEPEMTTAEVERYFDELKAHLAPLTQAVAAAPQVDDGFLSLEYDQGKQWAFGLEMLEAIGFSLDHGRLDTSAHPFTSDFSRDDVRLTTFATPELQPALFATLHEGGHGIHSQRQPRRYVRTPLFGSPSFGVSESQSRLFENVVGRSKLFWSHHFPRLQQLFPEQLARRSLDDFYRAINKVEPSFIRVEADELTYHMHIILRFELEREMIAGTTAVDEVPDAWNAKMKEYLGIVPPSPAKGCLQDIHWSHGAFGYFPSYSMGSVLAVQLYDTAVAEDPRIVEELGRGRCGALRDWMERRVYEYGKKLPPAKLVERVTGSPLTVQPFVRYAREKYSEIYGL